MIHGWQLGSLEFRSHVLTPSTRVPVLGSRTTALCTVTLVWFWCALPMNSERAKRFGTVTDADKTAAELALATLKDDWTSDPAQYSDEGITVREHVIHLRAPGYLAVRAAVACSVLCCCLPTCFLQAFWGASHCRCCLLLLVFLQLG